MNRELVGTRLGPPAAEARAGQPTLLSAKQEPGAIRLRQVFGGQERRAIESSRTSANGNRFGMSLPPRGSPEEANRIAGFPPARE